MIRKTLTILSLVAFLHAGCTSTDSRGKDSQERVQALMKTAAIKVATDVATDAGYDVKKYRIKAEYDPDDFEWMVFFDLIEPVAYRGGDSHFTVLIHADGSTYLSRGR